MFIRILMFLLVISVLCVIYMGQENAKRKFPEQLAALKIIRYAVGEVDPRFQISRQEVEVLAVEATKIWERGLNDRLFQYDPNASLKINLIYDERQKSALYIEAFNQKMEAQAKQLDEMSSRLDQQYTELKSKTNQLDEEYKQLRTQLAGWSRLEFEDGENMQRLRLQEEVLRKRQRQLSDEREVYYMNQRLYNEKVADYNQQAQKGREFNQQNPSRLFHKGTYSGHEINIYQFSNQNDLKVTLAHEFGHALGLGHHQDPKALMYPLVAEQDTANFKLLASDIDLYQAQQRLGVIR